jgi:acyl-CoA thioesterase I
MKIQIFKHLLVGIIFVISTIAYSKPPLVLFIGDSLTEGFGIEKKNAFPQLIKDNLKKNHNKVIEILNAGVSGSTTASALSRLRWFIKKDPDIVVLALGANDGLRGINPKETYKNLKLALEFIKSKKKKVLFCGVRVPPNYGERFEKAFLKTFSVLAKQQKVPFYAHILKDVAGVNELNQEDGIHPNEKGHKVMAKNLVPKILELL